MPAKTPEEYRAEMMRMFRQSSSAQSPAPAPRPEPTPQPEPSPRPEPSPQPQPAPRPEPSPQPQPAPRPEPSLQPQPSPRPEPSPQPQPAPRPEPIPQPQPAPRPEPSPQPQPAPRPEPSPQPQPENTSFGWLKVITRTADNAYPIEGVSVLVRQERNGENHLLFSLTTDQSGETPRVQLPAPPVGNQQNQRFSTYQIQAFSPGYSRMESENVPIFPGITTLQPFAMIPLPFAAGNDSPTITNQNTEPTF